jgi:hypothetical protein
MAFQDVFTYMVLVGTAISHIETLKVQLMPLIPPEYQTYSVFYTLVLLGASGFVFAKLSPIVYARANEFAYLWESRPLLEFWISEPEDVISISETIMENKDHAFEKVSRCDEYDPNRALRGRGANSTAIPALNTFVHFRKERFQIAGRVAFKERAMCCPVRTDTGVSNVEENRRVVHIQIYENKCEYTQSQIAAELLSLQLTRWDTVTINQCELRPNIDYDDGEYLCLHDKKPKITFSRKLTVDERFEYFFSNYFRRCLGNYNQLSLSEFARKPLGLENKTMLEQNNQKYILHGDHGTGKTEFARRWAAFLRRGVATVRLDVTRPIYHLQDTLLRKKPDLLTDYVLVFEEFDRTIAQIVNQNVSAGTRSWNSGQKKSRGDEGKQEVKVTLEDINTFLDGPRELMGALVILTTNHIEYLRRMAPGLLRDRRADVVYFDSMKTHDLQDMCRYYFPEDEDVPLELVQNIPVCHSTASKWVNQASSAREFLTFVAKYSTENKPKDNHRENTTTTKTETKTTPADPTPFPSEITEIQPPPSSTSSDSKVKRIQRSEEITKF